MRPVDTHRHDSQLALHSQKVLIPTVRVQWRGTEMLRTPGWKQSAGTAARSAVGCLYTLLPHASRRQRCACIGKLQRYTPDGQEARARCSRDILPRRFRLPPDARPEVYRRRPACPYPANRSLLHTRYARRFKMSRSMSYRLGWLRICVFSPSRQFCSAWE